MKTVVCVKEVPNPCLPVEIDSKTNAVKDEEWNYVINACDEVAVEEAVRIKEKFGGEVTVITLGVARAEAILRRCLAIGAEKAIHLCGDMISVWDAYTTALILAKTISQLSYDIVLCGFRSLDRGGGEVGNIIAELLGLPVVTAVVNLEVSADERSATVCSRLERGARQIKRCRLPAVFTTDLMLNEPRYPTLTAIKNSLKKEITKIAVESLEVEPGEALTKLIRISRPSPKKVFIPTGSLSPTERIRLLTQGAASKKSSNLLEGSSDEVARKVVGFLSERHFLS